jgi:DNA-directed RNA polymerase, omega subunit
LSTNPEGITNPPIDDLLDKVDSKYRLVIFAAKRARQINAYYSQLGEGLLENVGPLVGAAPPAAPPPAGPDPAFAFVDPFAELDANSPS